MRELFARIGEDLGTRLAGQIGLIGEMGKKGIQFSMSAGLETRIIVTRMTGKIKTRWRIYAED